MIIEINVWNVGALIICIFLFAYAFKKLEDKLEQSKGELKQ